LGFQPTKVIVLVIRGGIEEHHIHIIHLVIIMDGGKEIVLFLKNTISFLQRRKRNYLYHFLKLKNENEMYVDIRK